ncbi:MAG: hypothetical protein IJ783_09875 [Kiritimatiellae bacterium]|nr:hypothetical protein [Kiritimatiellia bacterium]
MTFSGRESLRLFQYRHGQTWPPSIAVRDGWRATYDDQKGDLPVLPTVEEAVAWANDLVARIDAAR